jgi:prolyl oligopeptidase
MLQFRTSKIEFQSLNRAASGFYYNLQRRDTGIRVFYHAIGADPSKDVEIFGKGYGPDKWVGGSVSEDGKYLLFEVSHGWARNEVYVQKLPDGPIQTIVNDIPAHFNAWFAGDRLIMQTDWQTPNQRIVVVDLNNPARENWREIIPEGRDAIAQQWWFAGRGSSHAATGPISGRTLSISRPRHGRLLPI